MAGKPKYKPNRKQLDTWYTLLAYAAIGSLVFLAIGLHPLENYSNWVGFAVARVLAGIVFGIVGYSALAHFIPKVKTYKSGKGVGFLFVLILLFINVFFGLGELLNDPMPGKGNCGHYVITEVHSSRRSWYVFIKSGDSTERLSFGKDFTDSHHAGDTIELCLLPGGLGGEYYRLKRQ